MRLVLPTRSVKAFAASVPKSVPETVPVMPRSSKRFDSHVRTGFTTARNFVLPLAEVTVEETSTNVLRGPDGSTLTVADGTFTPDDATRAASADRAADTRDQIRLVSVVLPVALVVLGAVLLLLGVRFLRPAVG